MKKFSITDLLIFIVATDLLEHFQHSFQEISGISIQK